MEKGLDDREHRGIDRQRGDENDQRRDHEVRKSPVLARTSLPSPRPQPAPGFATQPTPAPVPTVARARGTARVVPVTGRAVGHVQPPSEATCEAMALIALATVSWPAAAL